MTSGKREAIYFKNSNYDSLREVFKEYRLPSRHKGKSSRSVLSFLITLDDSPSEKKKAGGDHCISNLCINLRVNKIYRMYEKKRPPKVVSRAVTYLMFLRRVNICQKRVTMQHIAS